jgi:large subunit ribosomal protein L3
MTQLVSEDGTVTPVTVIVAKCVVVDKRTAEKHGYDALVLGLDERAPKHTSKPLAGQFKKLGVSPKRVLCEFRCEPAYAAGLEIGQEVALDQVFEAGQLVDVRATSRGKGFAGVMKRHGFHGTGRSHGAHEVHRHGGSIGTNMTPGRVLPGKKMPGQLGNKKVSILNQTVAKVIPEKGLVLLAGAVPGAPDTLVELRGAVKKRGGRKAS